MNISPDSLPPSQDVQGVETPEEANGVSALSAIREAFYSLSKSTRVLILILVPILMANVPPDTVPDTISTKAQDGSTDNTEKKGYEYIYPIACGALNPTRNTNRVTYLMFKGDLPSLALTCKGKGERVLLTVWDHSNITKKSKPVVQTVIKCSGEGRGRLIKLPKISRNAYWTFNIDLLKRKNAAKTDTLYRLDIGTNIERRFEGELPRSKPKRK